MPAKLLASLSLLLLLAVSSFGWFWRPKRARLSVALSEPRPMELVDGASPSALTVDFGGSAAPLEAIGRETSAARLIPQHPGAWSWRSDRSLVFTPTRDWPAGAVFRVQLDRKKLSPHVEFETLQRSFKTAPFRMDLSATRFEVDDVDPKLKRVVAELSFSHAVDTESLEKAVFLSFGRTRAWRSFPFTVGYDKFMGRAWIKSAPVPVPLDDETMSVEIRAGVRAHSGGDVAASLLSGSARIPGLYSLFRVESSELVYARNERLEPQLAFALRLSAGASEQAVADSLSLHILPKNRPEAPGRSISRDHWWRSEEVGPELLAQSFPLKLGPEPADRAYPLAHSFRVEAPPGAFVHLRLRKGLASYGGYILPRDYETVIRVPELPREVKILHDGAILKLSGERTLSLYSLGLSHLRLEAARVRPSQIQHLISQTEGDFAHPAFRDWGLGPDNITERFEHIRAIADPAKLRYTSQDFGALLHKPGSGSRNGLFLFTAEGWDPIDRRPIEGKDSRLILVTDLGIVIKDLLDGSREVFVQSLADGRPVIGARVEVLALNGVALLSADTDGSGRAKLPRLKDFVREKRAVAILVRHGEDFSFLPFDRHDRRLDFSRFDVGGLVTEGDPERLEAYLFNDRGLYRPGEEFHIGVIVRSRRWQTALAGVPVEATITDPRGLELLRKTITLDAAALHTLSYKTFENSPTGEYQASVYILKDGRRHGLIGSGSARVEEFEPDRMRIETKISAERGEGWVSPRELKGLVTLKTLFGTPASGRKVSSSIRLVPASPHLPRFPGFQFTDPTKAKKDHTEMLPDGLTDAEGRMEIPLGVDRFADAMLRLEFSAEGFEAEAGRGVQAESSVIVSERPFLVGVRPDGALDYVAKGSTRSFELVAAGPEGFAVAASSLTLELIERRHVSALVRQESGMYRYQTVTREEPVGSWSIAISAKRPLKRALDSARPGEFVLLVKDAAGLELARLPYTVAGQGNLARGLERSAELELTLESADAVPGRELSLLLKAPYEGSGLITIEREKVFAHKWFRMNSASSTQTIRVPEGIDGSAYVVVSLLRGPDSKERFTSPLSYAAKPITINRAQRSLPLELQAPSEIRPGTPLKFRVRAARGARAVLMAADEGILQAAGWQKPDPLAHFLRKRALEVRTSQILDLLLPDHRESAKAPGGDSAEDALGKNLNPFKRRRDKPAVFWSGVLELGPEWQEIIWTPPEGFDGTVRATLVAVEAGSIGVADKKTLVRGPLVVTPNAPHAVAPGDEFETSFAVANVFASSAALRLLFAGTPGLELLGAATAALSVPRGAESVALMRLRAKALLGPAELSLAVQAGTETVRRRVTMSIRPASPYRVELQVGHMKKGRMAFKIARPMHTQFASAEAALSHLPLVIGKSLVVFLDNYAYYCTEQLLSRAFPALILAARPELGGSAAKAEQSFAGALAVLRARQNADGAFGFYAANSHVSDFQTVYAMHFLTEAREKGHHVPAEALERGLRYLEALGAGSQGLGAEPRVRAYALYVMTRNGKVTTPHLDALRQTLEKDESQKRWRKELTAAYLGASYKILRLEGPAESLFRGVAKDPEGDADYESFYDRLIHRSQRLYLLARHFPERLRVAPADELSAIVEPIAGGEYHTLGAAYALLALDAAASALGEVTATDAELDERSRTGTRALPLSTGLVAKAEFNPGAENLELRNRSAIRLFYSVATAGFDRQPGPEKHAGLELRREFQDESGKAVGAAKLGQELSVVLRVRSLKKGHIPNVAVVDLLPGGFDPLLSRASISGPHQYVDIREDRALFFGSAELPVREYRYKIKATNRGRFIVPPSMAESMYDRTLQAQSAPATLTVE